MKYIFQKTLFVISLFVLFSSTVFAASVYIYIDKGVSVGDTFEVDIHINTDGTVVNSINATVDFDEKLVTFAGYKSENGIMKLWVDVPYEKDGKIYFSGIVPGGILGSYNEGKSGDIPLVALLFTAKHEGNAEFSFIKTELLKNDGKGTTLSSSGKGKTITIKSSINQVEENDINYIDNTPPETFNMTFVESSPDSGTPDMIVFNAEDALSGIKEYKIKIGNNEWQEVKNPQPVEKKIFPYKITARAYDFYDNFQEESIFIPGVVSFKLLIIGLILVLAGIWGYKVLKYRA